MEYVKLGIIGIGTMGSVHVQSIMEGKIARCKLTAVCDPKRERLKRAFHPPTLSFQSKICCARLRRMQS
jgi:predicted dehydrogenase